MVHSKSKSFSPLTYTEDQFMAVISQRDSAEHALTVIGNDYVRVCGERDKFKERLERMELSVAHPEYPEDMHGKPVTADYSYFNYDMSKAPVGGKLIVLNHGGVATFSNLSSENKKDFQAWAPLPKTRKNRRF